ncbi:centromere protein S-like [Littorina saxatilis]|uniref:centromere protein S-like n=1 Tax=Littorina saxatilis TaxID=31220 RepID=UPI0038B524F5
MKMATAGDQSIEEEYQVLSTRQKLKAAMHYTTMKICQETEEKYDVSISQQGVAAIAETLWRQTESFASDLELFAKHARRSVISPDDIKLLVRRNPHLLKHIQNMHAEQTSGREETKKRGRKKKTTQYSTDTTVEQETAGDFENDENSNL